MTDTVTKLAGRHRWKKSQRRDDPSRHIYTCLRDGCGLMKRSERVDGEWLELWRWPDGEEGQGRKAPSCRAGQPAVDLDAGVPLEVAVAEGAVPPAETASPACCRCVPPLEPCNQPTHLYLGGPMCDWQAGLSSGAVA